jgi:hypothetical protein
MGLAPQTEPETEPEDGGEAPSPEEQAQYDKFVKNGYKMIYGDKATTETVLDGLSGGGDPVAGLANMTATLVARLVESARRNGVVLSDDVVFAGGMEIFDDLANLQREAGIAELSEEQAEAALFQAMDRYREMGMQGGWIDPQRAAEDIKALREAETSGRLDEAMPGLGEYARKRGIQAGPPEDRGRPGEVTKASVREQMREMGVQPSQLVQGLARR